MSLAALVATSARVTQSSGRLHKIEHLAEFLRRLPPDDLEPALAFLAGSPRQGRMNIGSSLIRQARATSPAASTSLTIHDIDVHFDRIAAISGAGANRARAQLLSDVFARATADEQDFLARLLFGELRQGALEGVLLEAVGRASGVPADAIRRAVMLEGTFASVARKAITEGASALEGLTLRPFRPIQPMLADSAADVDEALEELGEASLEFKLDGARVQVHKVGDEVRVYSRTLRDVTDAVPEVVDAARTIRARDVVLDGEAIALRADGTPQPFQVTMRRFGRKRDVDALRQTIPISALFFDCLFSDGGALVDEPLVRRAEMLAAIAPPALVVPRLVTADAIAASAFMARARAAGHEGVMAKALAGGYAAGRRGQAWLKIKPAITLDLVVLAVEWGSGRRTGSLSNLHLGARDDERGGFVMLGKTFKGMTDDMLAWQTAKLLELELGRDGHIVFVRPELVVEVAFNDLQVSPQYPGGLALRFARVKRYRSDKSAADADTFRAVQRIYKDMTGLDPP